MAREVVQIPRGKTSIEVIREEEAKGNQVVVTDEKSITVETNPDRTNTKTPLTRNDVDDLIAQQYIETNNVEIIP